MICSSAERVDNWTIALLVAAVCRTVVRRLGRAARLAKKVIIITNCLLLITNLTSCSSIDDDLSGCKTDDSVDFKMDYELRLVTNMTTELHTQLGLETNVALAAALKNHLSGIFTDHAHDVDLSFYDTQGDMPRLQHDQHIMDANQASYTLFLPKRQYKHLAVANVLNNKLVQLNGDERCRTSMLNQTVPDTINSHTTGLFTARQAMDVQEGVDQTFTVRLYMANCAAALVIDPRGHDVSGLKVYTTGFASQFNINDSTYTFAAKDPIVRTDKVTTDSGSDLCYVSVNFPSREPSTTTTRSVIETEDFLGEPGNEPLWSYIVHFTNEDGSITQTVLTLMEPLRAGQLKILKGHVASDGSIKTVDTTVGVSVTLNWHEGWNFDPEL